MFKFGVSTYSFSQIFGKERNGKPFGIAELLDAAVGFGFEAVDFSELPGYIEGTSKIGYARGLREMCKARGLTTSNYAIAANFMHDDPAAREAEIARVCTEVEVAAELGVATMRHDVAWGVPDIKNKARKGFDSYIERMADGCRRVTQYAKSHGIATCVENHGTFCQDSERVERLCDAVADANFGVLVDIGNFMCADERPELAVARLAPFAKHVHVKDFHYKTAYEDAPGEGWFSTRAGNRLRGAIAGHGVVPVRQCLDILRASGYEGGLSLEFEGIEDCMQGIRMGRDFLKQLGVWS